MENMQYCEKFWKNFNEPAIQFSIVTVDAIKTSKQFNACQVYVK